MRIEDLPTLIKPAQLAALLGLAPHTLAMRRSTGKGDMPPFVKLGTARSAGVRYRRDDVIEWMYRRGLITDAQFNANR